MLGILCEKPSAARNFSAALGGQQGQYAGTPYVIVAAAGHLFEFAAPEAMVPEALVAQYTNWDMANLPWKETDFSWKYCVRGEGTHPNAENAAFARSTLKNIRNVLRQCDEICIATDDDPSGEGELLAWEILSQLQLRPQKWSRMYFADEAPKSIQKAFRERKTLRDMVSDPDYIQAFYRARWDYMSMQWTRVAKALTGCVLRQGRLKSAMVTIVGDQLQKIKQYQKIPYYQVRFKDENGNVYSSEDEPQFPKKSDAPIGKYTDSPVVVDSKEKKFTPPPKLIDLAMLASKLAPKGFPSKMVLDTYQKMYEAQVVSYPRTEDKYITHEQFSEMLPLVDRIADLVGVDKKLLTHRAPRSTHVKEGCAHGANRPGPNVPASLAALSSFGPCAADIYTLLAKNFLTMFAEDYEYEAQKGHLEKYPKFKGTTAIPLKAGWKAVDAPDAPEEQDGKDKPTDKALGSMASPFVHEGFPPKPATPTMKWLMSQLEKNDVGTGATRTSTYGDVTSKTTKYPLLIDTKGKITMSPYGEASYRLIQGTHIGGVAITEQVTKEMRDVAAGKADPDALLYQIRQYIVDDIAVMQNNVSKLAGLDLQEARAIVGKCPRCGRDVIEGRKGFGCSGWNDQNSPCNFTIWKNNGLLAASGKELTAVMAKQLLKDGKCDVHGLKSKSGSKYDGKLVLQDDGDKVRLEFEFLDDEEAAVGKCPRCGRPVTESAKAFGCVGYRDESNPCSFTIWKSNRLLEASGKSVTKTMAKSLLKDGKCHVTGLKSKARKTYAADLVLKDDGERVNLELSFDETPKRRSSGYSKKR